MRFLVALLLLFAASCSPRDDNTANNAADNDVDIGTAAEEAQGSIDAYANTTQGAPGTPVPEPAPGAVTILAPLAPPAPGKAGGPSDDPRPVSAGR